MPDLQDAAVLAAWAVVFAAAWSAIAIAVLTAGLAIPVLLGRWRLARIVALLMAAACLCLWIATLLDLRHGVSPPTRYRAGLVVWPLAAFWSVIAAYLITRHRLKPRMPAEHQVQGDI